SPAVMPTWGGATRRGGPGGGGAPAVAADARRIVVAVASGQVCANAAEQAEPAFGASLDTGERRANGALEAALFQEKCGGTKVPPAAEQLAPFQSPPEHAAGIPLQKLVRDARKEWMLLQLGCRNRTRVAGLIRHLRANGS